MKRERALNVTLVVLLSILVVMTGVNVFLIHKQPHRQWAIMKPSGKVVESPNYDQAVNMAGGRNLHHEFEYGREVNGKWTPTGKVYKW